MRLSCAHPAQLSTRLHYSPPLFGSLEFQRRSVWKAATRQHWAWRLVGNPFGLLESQTHMRSSPYSEHTTLITKYHCSHSTRRQLFCLLCSRSSMTLLQMVPQVLHFTASYYHHFGWELRDARKLTVRNRTIEITVWRPTSRFLSRAGKSSS